MMTKNYFTDEQVKQLGWDNCQAAYKPENNKLSYEFTQDQLKKLMNLAVEAAIGEVVADALENAAKEIDLMVNTYIESGNKYHEVSEGRERCVNKARAAMSCAETIRAFIKRNAEEGEDKHDTNK